MLDKIKNVDPLIIIGILKNRVLRGPRRVVLHIISNCNLNCEYCWYYSPLLKNGFKFNETHLMNFTTISKIVTELKSLGTEYINLSGDGEPWLHPEICQIIDCIKKSGILLSINTNLTFDDKYLIRAFAKCDSLRVNFSAPDKDLYLKSQSKNPKNYYNLIRNLKLYSKIYKNTNKPNIELVYVLTKNNYKYVEKMLNIADELNINCINFKTPMLHKSLNLTKKEISYLENIIPPMKAYAVKTNLKDIVDSYAVNDGYGVSLNKCFVGWIALSISLRGDIGFCCVNEKLVFGNIYRESVIDAWNSSKAQLLRLIAKNNFNLKKVFWEDCIHCYIATQNKTIGNYLEEIKT